MRNHPLRLRGLRSMLDHFRIPAMPRLPLGGDRNRRRFSCRAVHVAAQRSSTPGPTMVSCRLWSRRVAARAALNCSLGIGIGWMQQSSRRTWFPSTPTTPTRWGGARRRGGTLWCGRLAVETRHRATVPSDRALSRACCAARWLPVSSRSTHAPRRVSTTSVGVSPCTRSSSPRPRVDEAVYWKPMPTMPRRKASENGACVSGFSSPARVSAFRSAAVLSCWPPIVLDVGGKPILNTSTRRDVQTISAQRTIWRT